MVAILQQKMTMNNLLLAIIFAPVDRLALK